MSQDNKINNQENDAKFEDVVEDNQGEEDIAEDNATEKNIEPKKKKKSFKSKVILVETIVLILLLVGAYLYYSIQTEKRQEVNNTYEQLQILEEEKEYCQELVSDVEGNFNQRDYCELLLRKFK